MQEAGNSTGRGAGFKRDWTKGSITPNLSSLSWPILINNSFYQLGPTIDMIWVAKLGATSIAGVGVAGIVVMLVLTAKAGLMVGLRAMVARFVGAGDVTGANNVARQALVISAVYAAIITPIGFFLAEPILNLFRLESDVIAEGTAYLRIHSLAWIPTSFWVTTYTIMQGSGDMVNPMRIAMYARFVHWAIVSFLVFGWWIFPRLGVSGAALSNVVGESLGMLISFWILFSGRSRLRLSLSNFRLDPNIIWRMMKIGFPALVVTIQRALSNLVFAWVMAPFGTLAVAAHSLVQRVEAFLFLPGTSFGRGAGVLVGQNLGAHQPERAERSSWLAASLTEGIMLILAVVILLWAESIIGIFNTEPGLVEVASAFLRIAVVGYLAFGLGTVLAECLSGAGDTLPAMLISLGDLWVVRLPLAFLLPWATNLGMFGVRWSIVIGMVVGAVAYVIYFRGGRWRRQRV